MAAAAASSGAASGAAASSATHTADCDAVRNTADSTPGKCGCTYKGIGNIFLPKRHKRKETIKKQALPYGLNKYIVMCMGCISICLTSSLYYNWTIFEDMFMRQRVLEGLCTDEERAAAKPDTFICDAQRREISNLYSAIMYTDSFVASVGGYIGDRYGAYYPLLIGQVAGVVAFVMFYLFSQSTIMLYVTFFFWGISCSFALAPTWHYSRMFTFGNNMAVSVITAADNMSMFTPTFLQMIAMRYKIGFTGASLTYIFWAILVCLAITLYFLPKRYIVLDEEESDEDYTFNSMFNASLKNALKDMRYWLSVTCYVLLCSVRLFYRRSFTLLFFDNEEVTEFLEEASDLSFVGSFVLGYMNEYFGVVTMMSLTTMMYIAALIAVYFRNFPCAYTSALLFAIAQAGDIQQLITFIDEVFPEHESTLMGLSNIVNTIGGVILQVTFNYVFDWLGPRITVFLMILILGGVLVICYIIELGMQEEKVSQQEEEGGGDSDDGSISKEEHELMADEEELDFNPSGPDLLLFNLFGAFLSFPYYGSLCTAVAINNIGQQDEETIVREIDDKVVRALEREQFFMSTCRIVELCTTVFYTSLIMLLGCIFEFSRRSPLMETHNALLLLMCCLIGAAGGTSLLLPFTQIFKIVPPIIAMGMTMVPPLAFIVFGWLDRRDAGSFTVMCGLVICYAVVLFVAGNVLLYMNSLMGARFRKSVHSLLGWSNLGMGYFYCLLLMYSIKALYTGDCIIGGYMIVMAMQFGVCLFATLILYLHLNHEKQYYYAYAKNISVKEASDQQTQNSNGGQQTTTSSKNVHIVLGEPGKYYLSEPADLKLMFRSMYSTKFGDGVNRDYGLWSMNYRTPGILKMSGELILLAISVLISVADASMGIVAPSLFAESALMTSFAYFIVRLLFMFFDEAIDSALRDRGNLISYMWSVLYVIIMALFIVNVYVLQWCTGELLRYDPSQRHVTVRALRVSGLEYAQRPVEARSDYRRGVRRNANTHDPGVVVRQNLPALVVRSVPNLQVSVERTRGEVAPVRRLKLNVADQFGVGEKRAAGPQLPQVEELHGVVVRRSCENVAVEGMEVDRSDLPVVHRLLEDVPPSPEVHYQNHPMSVTGCNEVPIPVQRQTVNAVTVPLLHVKLLHFLHVEEPDCLVRGRAKDHVFEGVEFNAIYPLLVQPDAVHTIAPKILNALVPLCVEQLPVADILRLLLRRCVPEQPLLRENVGHVDVEGLDDLVEVFGLTRRRNCARDILSVKQAIVLEEEDLFESFPPFVLTLPEYGDGFDERPQYSFDLIVIRRDPNLHAVQLALQFELLERVRLDCGFRQSPSLAHIYRFLRKMFESKIIYLLNKLLEPYVDGVDENTLHLGKLLSGKVVLNGLNLKPSIVDHLGLPFHLTFGLIDNVKLSIHLPLLHLSKRKLVIDVNNVIVLLTAMPENQWDSEAYREEYIAQKVATLAAESLKQVVTEIQGGGFIWRMVVSFLENLELRINNVHIRIEDYTTNPNLSYAFGVVIKSAVFLTDGKPAAGHEKADGAEAPLLRSFYNDNGQMNPTTIHRCIELTGFGAYIDRLDPLRPGMMQNSDSLQQEIPKSHPSRQTTVSHNESSDEGSFMDAVSYATGASHSHGVCGGGHRGMHFAHVYRRDRLRYNAAVKVQPYRKELRIKGRRAGDSVRSRLRFVRYSCERQQFDHPYHQGPRSALAPFNAVIACMASRVMKYLSTGEHNAGCDRVSRNGWQRHSTRSSHRRHRRHGSPAGAYHSPSHKAGSFEPKAGVKREPRASHRGFRRSVLPDVTSVTVGRINSNISCPAQGSHQAGLPDPLWGDRSAVVRRGLAGEISPEGVQMYPEDPTFANTVGYISSGSTWRILLSTFCNIQKPSEEQHRSSLGLIDQARTRFAKRRHFQCSADKGEAAAKPKVSSRSTDDYSTDGASIETSAQTGDDPAAAESVSSTPQVLANVFGMCSSVDCVLSDVGSDSFDEEQYNAEKDVPLSYDETWHTHSSRGSSLTASDSGVASDPGAAEPECASPKREAGEPWTRFGFTLNREEDPALKELFLRSLDETVHNYIVNPKECNGSASFYFCMYPTPPYVQPRTCWSAWGSSHDSRLYKNSMSAAKDYVPRCSVFLRLEGLCLVVSKEQVECLLNVIYENLFKHMSWQAGVISTFENPRAEPRDESLYMESWPQYLLLGQTSNKNELREFIMDFELLHSTQSIRILRHNASEALRDLIRSFGERHGFGCDPRDCLTDVLFMNICGQYDEGEGVEITSEDCSRLRARLKIVGGIYEIAAKHAKSNVFLDSLRKICQPPTMTFDFAFDLVLMNSRIVYTFDTDPQEDYGLSGKVYVLSARGLHFYVADVYGRGGCQVMEAELLPFSLVSFGYKMSSENAELHSMKDCPCHLMGGPASVLLSCGTVAPRPGAARGSAREPKRSRAMKKLNELKRDFALGFMSRPNSETPALEDPCLYLGLSFSRYCTPDEADVRTILHVNGDLFGHLRVLDDLGDYLRMKKYNKRHYGRSNPVLIGPSKKQGQLAQDSTGSYRELYELIDLGVEYSKSLLQGSIPFTNLDFFIEENHQVALMVDLGSSAPRPPYVVCVDSFAVASDVTPRLVEPHEDSPYDSHVIRLSNLRVLSLNGDYSFLADGARREVYLGVGSGVRLLDYLDLVSTPRPSGAAEDPVVALSLSRLQSNFELLSVGRDNELFVKVKCANSATPKRGIPKVVVTASLGSIYASLRECDLLDFIGAYADYVAVTNDYAEFIHRRSRGRPRAAEFTPKAARGPSLLDHGGSGVESADVKNPCSHSEFRALVAQKWLEQQQQKFFQGSGVDTASSVVYEIKLDYLFFEIRRLVRLDTSSLKPSRSSGYGDSPGRSSPDRTPVAAGRPSNYHEPWSAIRCSYTSATPERSPGRMIILPTSEASSFLQRTPDRPLDARVRRSHRETHYAPGGGHMVSRHSAACSTQSVLTRYGVTLPLLSCKVTCVSLKAAYSAGRLERLRAVVGCIEVEDQTNSVPLYLSALFVGGDTTLLWRWLKVSREVHLVRSGMDCYSEHLNESMAQLLRRGASGLHTGRLEPDDAALRQRLCHVDYASVRFSHRLTHEYKEDPFFRLKEPAGVVARAYRCVEDHLDSAMDNKRVADKHAMHDRNAYGLCAPFFMIACLDYDENDHGRSTVDFSHGMVNIAWEVVDELLCLCMSLWENLASIPEAFTAATDWSDAPRGGLAASVNRSEHWSLDTTMSVEQSSLHVLCDSSWVGHKNFVDYMWFKLLRDSYNVAEPEGSCFSGAGSSTESLDLRSALYLGVSEQALSQRGVLVRSGYQLSNSSTSGEMFPPPAKLQSLEKKREQHPKHSLRKQASAVGTKAGLPAGDACFSRLRWRFVSAVLRETYRKAFLSTPIYMRVSSRGTLYLSVSTGPAEPTNYLDLQAKTARAALFRPECPPAEPLGGELGSPSFAIYLRACGGNISGHFSRDFSCRVLTPCGFQMVKLRPPSPATENFKRQHFDFLKYIRPHRKRDPKFFSLLELSRRTLYDPSEPYESHFMKPFRLELSCGTLLHCESGAVGRLGLPQSVCVTMTFETLKVSVSCVDILSFCNLVGLLSASFGVEDGGGAASTGTADKVPITDTAPSNSNTSDEPTKTNREKQDESCAMSDEFYSCTRSVSDSDWVSVDSSAPGEDSVEPRSPFQRKYTPMKTHRAATVVAPSAQPPSNGGLLERLLSQVGVGLKLSFDLIYIELSSNYSNEVDSIFTATVEDLGFLLWSNRICNWAKPPTLVSHVGSLSDAHMLDASELKKETQFSEPLSVTPVYSQQIEDRISLCLAGVHYMLSPCEVPHEPSCSGPCSPKRSIVDVMEDSHPDCALIFEAPKGFLWFESRMCVTVDIRRGMGREMLMEPVRLNFRGSKPSVQAKTFANLSTSWINVNVSLNGAQCVFAFLRHISGMARLRTAFLEQHRAEFLAFQPAVACKMDSDLSATMCPVALTKELAELHPAGRAPPVLGLANPLLPVWEMPAAIEFRLRNNIFPGPRDLDLHACLLSSMRSLGAFKMEGDASCAGSASAPPFAGPAVSQFKDSTARAFGSISEKDRETSYLLNTLGQPIAVGLYINPAYESTGDCEWRVVDDGETCALPVGHYGIILPFVVRLQLNNCVYEVPSSMLHLTQEEEIIFRLDVSRKFLRSRHANRMAFLRTMRQERTKTQLYRFGVGVGCTRFVVSEMGLASHPSKAPFTHLRHSGAGWCQRALRRFRELRRGAGVPLHLFEHEEFKYAYVMVKTRQHMGARTSTTASATHFSLQFSSTLWLSNQSHEKLVVFPSVSMDPELRLVPSSSLVWLEQHPPPTTALPLSHKTVESHRAIAVVKSVGNNLFKQLTNMQETKHAIKRLAPAHVMNPVTVGDPMLRAAHQFRLQHLVLPEFSYKPQRLSVPLSWTIEPSCTICVCLQDDFPVDVGGDPSAAVVRCADLKLFDLPEGVPDHFTGDVLLSTTSAQHLYDSFELQRVNTPIRDYVARVHLGHVSPDDIFASGINTGFVQDITCASKPKETTRMRSQSLSPTTWRASHSGDKASTRGDTGGIPPKGGSFGKPPNEDSSHPAARSGPSRLFSPYESLDREAGCSTGDSGIASDALATTSGIGVPIPQATREDMANERENSASISSQFASDCPSAYVVYSQTVARLSSSRSRSRSYSRGVVIRRFKRVEHMLSLRSNSQTLVSPEPQSSFTRVVAPDLPPKAILSSTLIEVTSFSRSRYGPKTGRSGIKHYEIALESCHVIENMMPFDMHILSPATYDHLNRSRPAEGEPAAVPLYPLLIKASSSAQFSWYMKNGRFVFKEMLSREFNMKPPAETVGVSSLVFETMQPQFAQAFSALFDGSPGAAAVGLPVATAAAGGAGSKPVGTLPRHMVVSVEVSRKPVDPVNERGGLEKRYLASSQFVYTLFADKWIVNWLNYPISLCRGDGRYKQTIPAQHCTLVSHDLSSTSLQLAIRKSVLKHISNFSSYPKRSKRRVFTFDRSGETHVMSSTFTLPDLAFSTCDFRDTVECPRLHYLISTSMAPAPFFRTSVLEVLPQTTVTNEFDHPLWLREPDAPGGSGAYQRCDGWIAIEPGATIEFHSQVKGETVVEITGVDPVSLAKGSIQLASPSDSTAFSIWSSRITLKPSDVIQFRYPASASASACSGTKNGALGSPKSTAHAPRPVRYGLCEAEIRMHRGAKMVRFQNPSIADWVLLNTTGLDLWVEQQGVPGCGEVVPTVGAASGVLSERYAGLGVPFACYDPYKEHKLICRFHVSARTFKLLQGQYGKAGRRKNDSSIANARLDQSMDLLNLLPLRHVLNRRGGRAVRVKGSLAVNLSRVESMRCSSVFQIKYGGNVISMRLTAQTCVAFGQKTLHFTVVRVPSRAYPRIRPLQLLHIYSALRDKLTVPRDVEGGVSFWRHPISSARSALRRLFSLRLFGDRQTPLSIRKSRFGNKLRAMFSKDEQPSFVSVAEAPVRSKLQQSRGAGAFNWEYVFQVNVLGLGTAICGCITEELLYVSSTLIKLRVTLDNDEHMFSLSLGWIQSDVHDTSTCYPTMLRPLASWHAPVHMYELKRRVHDRVRAGAGHKDKEGAQQAEPHVVTITFNTRGSKCFSVREISNFRIELEPLSLNLDTRIGQAMLMLVDEYISVFGFSGATSEYFTTANVGIFSNTDSWLDSLDSAQYPLQEVARSQFSKTLSGGTRYNISNLHVGRVTLTINIRRSGLAYSADVNAQNVIIRYLMHIVRRTPHISDASIILAQESLQELCCTPYALLMHFAMRYITQSVQQIYKVLGAVDLIGNPKIVLHHWLTGFCQAMSTMRESLQYLHLPPVAVFLWFRSVSRMGVSMVSGIADALYRLTGSWYLLFNTLACNTDRYAVLLMQDAFGKSVDQPSNVMEGIIFGGQSVGRNLYVSLGNFALKPLHQLMREVLLSGVHILGSLVSSFASLTFGTVSSLLSGVSLLSQGVLHQIHSVPMLSAIRPQRSLNLLKTSGAIGYNFLESWSMGALRQVGSVTELLLLLPLDGKLKLFDPVYTAMSHWSALATHMALVSPIAVCTPSSALQTFLWMNRTHIGLTHRRRLLWRCESKWISSIEIFRVPATNYQSPRSVRYDDSVLLEVPPKLARKHFSTSDSYYLRVIHVCPDPSQAVRVASAAVPPPLLNRMLDEGTFPSLDGAPTKAAGAYQSPAAFDNADDVRPVASRQFSHLTSVQHLYQESMESMGSELVGITIDKYERGTEDLQLFGQSPVTSRPSCRSSIGRSQSAELNEEASAWLDNMGAAKSASRLGTFLKVTRAAKVVRLPNMEIARLYFTLMISVLREATL
ncbi:WD domain, G-beta repeat family protein [Babesia caballi]|uniref:WD domain, G-beta repeat family protein n=1 Tax=Babesia caballi TaxID=5871 RepID=A0AAV4LVY1_BABCB|nr:WD domain, G-beta repeat family protein [Babesia caballi]